MNYFTLYVLSYWKLERFNKVKFTYLAVLVLVSFVFSIPWIRMIFAVVTKTNIRTYAVRSNFPFNVETWLKDNKWAHIKLSSMVEKLLMLRSPFISSSLSNIFKIFLIILRAIYSFRKMSIQMMIPLEKLLNIINQN